MKKVLFLVGPHASGKTYSSREYIAKNKNIGMIDTGPIMRRIHKEMDPDISMGDWVKKLEVQYGKDITSQLISNEIGKIMSNDECDKFILIGFRTLEGIAFTIQHLNIEFRTEVKKERYRLNLSLSSRLRATNTNLYKLIGIVNLMLPINAVLHGFLNPFNCSLGVSVSDIGPGLIIASI